jgi:3-oxo-5-alpha-steroid 4-dehydrogenase 3 / polyprenol reductase
MPLAFHSFSDAASFAPSNILALVPAPSAWAYVFFPLFFFASGMQYDVHHYLYDLSTRAQKEGPRPDDARNGEPSSTARYTLPTHDAFASLICPHYFADIMIYVCLAFLSAPVRMDNGKAEVLNGTMTCALIFVAVNLGITAQGTRRWWIKMWGEGAVKGKWCCVPYIW